MPRRNARWAFTLLAPCTLTVVVVVIRLGSNARQQPLDGAAVAAMLVLLALLIGLAKTTTA